MDGSRRRTSGSSGDEELTHETRHSGTPFAAVAQSAVHYRRLTSSSAIVRILPTGQESLTAPDLRLVPVRSRGEPDHQEHRRHTEKHQEDRFNSTRDRHTHVPFPCMATRLFRYDKCSVKTYRLVPETRPWLGPQPIQRLLSDTGKSSGSGAAGPASAGPTAAPWSSPTV